MDNLITIIDSKENEFDFNITLQGIDIDNDDIVARLVIETNEAELGFRCKKKEDEDSWSVKIPPLEHIEKTTYPFRFEVIVDGYYFEPLRGTANIVKSHEIFVTKKDGDAFTSKKPEKVENEEIVKQAMEKVDKKKIGFLKDIIAESATEAATTDKKVRDVLNNIKPKTKKKSPLLRRKDIIRR